MSNPTLALGSLRAVSVRLRTPWSGVWTAHVDAELGADGKIPTGATTIAIGATQLQATIDPNASGKFGEKVGVRALGGGGGWARDVKARHYHSDAGVVSTQVATTTAAEVGERIVDTKPRRLGADFARSAGRASRIFEGVDWYVDPSGITVIGTRPEVALSSTAQILEWDAEQARAEIASDEPILPGTVLTDSRFGTATVRDVEQTWGEGGARATVWCSVTEASRLVGAMRTLAREVTGVVYLRCYRYRIVLQAGDGRLNLQAIDKAPGLPDMLPISVFPGMSGLSAKYKPGTVVLVEFVGGDPSAPIVRSFETGVPLELTIEANLAIGITAPAVNIKAADANVTGALTAGSVATGALGFTSMAGGGMSGGDGVFKVGAGSRGVAYADDLQTWAAAVVTACAGAAIPIVVPPLSPSVASETIKGDT